MTLHEMLQIASDPNTAPTKVWEVIKYVSRSYWRETKTFKADREALIEAFRSNPARELWSLEDPTLAAIIFNR